MIKKKTTKNKKLPKISTLRDKLDKEFNTYIRERDGKCILSDDKNKLVCSHYYGKVASPILRWDERNAHAMTMKMHWKHHHGHEAEYAYWMYNKYGIKFMNKLYKDSLVKIEYTREDYLNLIKYYQNKREMLRNKK
jgi:hypothetical protein